MTDSSGSAVTRVRVIPELRNYHVALFPKMPAAETYFFSRKYDLVEGVELPAGLRQISRRDLARVLLRSRADVLELWEPLWMRELAAHGLLAVCWKAVRPFSRRRRIVSYAMENNDIASLVAGSRTFPDTVVRAFSLVIGLYIRVMYARFVFASEGSKRTYHSLPFVARVAHRVIPNLPGRPPLPPPPHDPGKVVFVGSMEKRKGLRVLMRAWEDVEDRHCRARLTLIGMGPLSAEVATWAAANPSRRTYLGGLDHSEAMRVMSSAEIGVLPSVREGRWREQIGLPIHEALLCGATVVTTDETGLASWLREHGHVIATMDGLPVTLTEALLAALDAPVTPDEVVESLPVEDGRVTANRLLHQSGR